MKIPSFKSPVLNLDLNTIGAVLGILAVIGAIVGGVVGSGALNDQSGSSRGASMEAIDTNTVATAPANENAEPSKAEPVEDYLSPEVRRQSDHFADLARQADEAIRQQEEIIRQQKELSRQAEDSLRQAEELRERRAAALAGLY